MANFIDFRPLDYCNQGYKEKILMHSDYESNIRYYKNTRLTKAQTLTKGQGVMLIFVGQLILVLVPQAHNTH